MHIERPKPDIAQSFNTEQETYYRMVFESSKERYFFRSVITSIEVRSFALRVLLTEESKYEQIKHSHQNKNKPRCCDRNVVNNLSLSIYMPF